MKGLGLVCCSIFDCRLSGMIVDKRLSLVQYEVWTTTSLIDSLLGRSERTGLLEMIKTVYRNVLEDLCRSVRP